VNIKHEVRKLIRNLGYDIVHYSVELHPLARKKKFLASYPVDVILDVGANTGQFAQRMRTDLGFSGRIVSFEPVSSAFKILKKNAAADPSWEALNYALGAVPGKSEINIAENSYSSSLLKMLPSHEKLAPESKYVGTEKIEVKTLDSIFDDICSKSERIYLKIDTQGFESRVIEGAERSLPYVDIIQLEMSLLPLYQDERLFCDLYRLLNDKGYDLVSVEPGYADKNTGRLLQVDGLFHRS
jgi:FkbM family methyltransferase